MLLIQTSGLTGGSGTETGYMPLHYDFTISPVAALACATTAPCTMDISWGLLLKLEGSAVHGGEVALPVVSGTGTGHFTGDAVLPYSSNPFISVGPMTLDAGSSMTVMGMLTLTAQNFANDASASFSVIVPEGASFDFQTNPVPEPATTGLLAAGLVLLGWRRFTSRA